jgi:hypothetical protein
MQIKNRTLVVAVAATALFASGFLVAQIDAVRFPHMAAAHHHGEEAYNELTQVDHSHGPQVDAHVNKAKDMLLSANRELDEAAKVATGK